MKEATFGYIWRPLRKATIGQNTEFFVGCPTPVDTSIAQHLYLRIGEHWGRGVWKYYKSQRTRMGHFLQDSVFYTWQESAPVQQGISSIWLPKHDLKNDTNWHTNGDGEGKCHKASHLEEMIQVINCCWERNNWCSSWTRPWCVSQSQENMTNHIWEVQKDLSICAYMHVKL